MAVAARVSGMVALTIIGMLLSSRIARRSATRRACGKRLHVGGGEIVLVGMHGDELGAGVEQRDRLAVDVLVVQADGGEAETGSCGHRFMPEEPRLR